MKIANYYQSHIHTTMIKTISRTIQIVLLVCLAPPHAHTQDRKKSDTITTIPQLRAAIEKVLKNTKTPAVGIAMVNANGPVWIAGLGKANLEKNIDADSATMFRIGSTSKMFVSLSILKLAEEGRLNLDDKVSGLVPELAFENKWEDTDPIRIANLLEHTTGWDDIHFCEYAYNDSTPATLKQGLDFHPHSRTSRWVPGTRMSYCNAGPPVAALIIEKITGRNFEDYVKENFFTPLGMATTTYLRTDDYRKKGATLYDNNKPQEYWHIIMRPSGSINSSAADMARMVQFFVNRARVDTTQLVSKASLQRMETAATTSGARAGMRSGYGLNNYTSPYKGFVYQSHNGGVNGGLTDLSYLPGYDVGYVVMINAGNGAALDQITKLIRNFQTRELTSPTVAHDVEMTQELTDLDGYYVSLNPRSQNFYFLERLLNIEKIWTDKEGLYRRRMLGGDTTKFWPADGALMKSPETGMTSMVKTTDPLEGEVLHFDTDVLKRLSWLAAFGPLIVACLWALFMVSAVIFGIFWVVQYLMGRLAGGANLQVRLWPLLASLCFFGTALFFFLGLEDIFLRLGKVTIFSAGITVLTITFALTSVMSLFVVFRYRNEKINRVVWWHSTLGAGLHVLVTLYLFYFGVIGMRIWA